MDFIVFVFVLIQTEWNCSIKFGCKLKNTVAKGQRALFNIIVEVLFSCRLFWPWTDLGKDFFEENKKDFSILEFEVHQINDLLNTITVSQFHEFYNSNSNWNQQVTNLLIFQSYQDYQKNRDKDYRLITKNLNTSIWYWGILQIFVLLVCGLLQMKTMKNFFLAKKLVWFEKL